MNEQQIDKILSYWFGDVDLTLPSPTRTHIWFNADESIDQEITTLFREDLEKVVAGEYKTWNETSRGRLASIILIDQFPRNIFRNTPNAFAYDQQALNMCIQGIKRGQDHSLSLIERAFFYMPMLHAENIYMQERSIIAYQMLANLSLPELAVIFKELLAFAIWHYDTIKKFGRFPQRNKILERPSTAEELEFLQ